MKTFNSKEHWNTIYRTKNHNDVSWFQPKPETSLRFFKEMKVPTSAKVIDIGGGDSLLVDYLLDLGYQDITVLDISEAAIEKAKERLKTKSNSVKWIVADVTDFKPLEKYDFWHDRAAFHFLTKEEEISKYLKTAHMCIKSAGSIMIGTFSKRGPKKCSGIEIKQYSEKSLSEKLYPLFRKNNCVTVDHTTPFKSIQNFVFCSFTKLD